MSKSIANTKSKSMTLAMAAAMLVIPTVGATSSMAATTDSSISSSASGSTTYSTTNIRSGPSTSTSIVGHASKNMTFSGTASNGWLHISSGPYAGKYVALSTLKLGSNTATNGTVTVRSIYSKTNIRNSASTSSSIASTITSGTSITGTLSGGWIHITSGPMAGKYISYSVVADITKASAPATTQAPAKPAPTTGTTSSIGDAWSKNTTPSKTTTTDQHNTSATPVSNPAPAPTVKLNTPYACSTNSATPNAGCTEAIQYVLNSWMVKNNAKSMNLLNISGSVDANTTSDIKTFQKANNLPETGTMDNDTWKALSTASASTNSTKTANIYGTPGDTHPAFPNTIKLEDGRLMMVFTSAQHHMGNTPGSTSTWKTYSSDGGYTWTKPVRIDLPNGYENNPAGLGIATSGPLKGHPVLTTWSKDSSNGTHTEVTIAADTEGDNWGQLVDLNSTFGHSTFSASPIVQVDDTNFSQAVYVYTGQGGSGVAETVGLTYDGTKFVVGTPSVIAAVANGATPVTTSSAKTSSGNVIGSVSTTATKNVPAAGTASSTAANKPANSTTASSSIGSAWNSATSQTSSDSKPATTAPSSIATNSISSTTGGFSEAGIVKLNDGRLLSLVRNDPKGNVVPGIYSSYSSDGGKTWTKPAFAFTGSGAPRMTVTSDGKVVVLFRHISGVSTPAGQANATYRVSTDNGSSWGAEQSAGEKASFEMAYGSPVANTDGTVTFAYANESDGNNAHMVTNPNVTVKK